MSVPIGRGIPDEIIDMARLSDYVKSSLGNLDLLRRVESFFPKSDSLSAILEDEFLRLLGDCENDEYMRWLCKMIRRLSRAEWKTKRDLVITAVCDPYFSGGPSLVDLALRSRILSRETIIYHLDLLPVKVLVQVLRVLPDEDFVLRVAGLLKDESILIEFLVHAEHICPRNVKVYLSEPERYRRLMEVLSNNYDSSDPTLRKFSVTLLKVILDHARVESRELILEVLAVAEQKQVHLIEPVLNMFIEAIQNGTLTDVPWILMVFRRLFNHPTTWVKLQSFRFFLRLTPLQKRIFETQNDDFFYGHFLDSLNQLSIYPRNPLSPVSNPAELGTLLRNWMRNVRDSIDGESMDSFFAQFITAVCKKVDWNSVALLYVTECIVDIEPRSVIEDLGVIVNALESWSMPEPLIKRCLVRYWLRVGCETTQLPTYEGLADFINRYAEECDAVDIFVMKIKRTETTPVDICSAIWSGCHDAVTFMERFGNSSKVWLSMYRIKGISSIMTHLVGILNSREYQTHAINILREDFRQVSVRRAVFELMCECSFDCRLVGDALTEPLPNWFVFCLWTTTCVDADPKIVARHLKLLTLRSQLKIMLASDLAPKILDCIASFCETLPEAIIDFVELVSNALPLAPQSLTPSLLKLLLAGLKFIALDDRRIPRMITLAWKNCLEARKATILFADCVDVFVKIYFHKVCIQHWSSTLKDVSRDLEEHSARMAWFGQKYYMALINLLAKKPELLASFYGKLGEALCYGPTFRKDQQIVLDTENYEWRLHTNVDFTGLSECRSAWEVRAHSLSFVKKPRTSTWTDQVIEGVLLHDTLVSSTRKRYFNNSNIHRVKTRAWQVILVLLETSTPTKNHEILTNVFKQLLNDNHQLTVRLLMEWCAVKILLKSKQPKSSIRMIMSAIETAARERVGCICSFLSILMHFCIARKNCDILSDSLETVLPWTMCQHFAVRLHAQFVFKRLIGLCRCTMKCHSQYTPFLRALDSVINYGDGAKTVQKLSQDFYMSGCVMTECETYEVIFDRLPKAYGLTEHDCIPPGYFDFDAKWSVENDDLDIHTDLQIEVLREECRPDETTVIREKNYQRKMIPVSNLFEEDRQPRSSQSGLVVVASLIDRIPNLGGISRTCEVFKASELVIPNLKMLESKEFLNLSVSSHHWLPIRAVSTNGLEAYLMEMKQAGYTLIGVEQTAKSVALGKYCFPLKSLLLLGHERGGLPAHLIDLMDACVEIPQQGVIRSLNVHVSAAILIWEYRRQFLEGIV
ncbi:uncharacterized protein LOC100902995 [Galendromus occidentalis]|uniref:tRNA (guanosine(18)-2'-O)-methyltransferase TARBP1 n=1 Tax=Galendromus occidentalis TaxID=34638 RepID=A0AAJ6QST0_9ACAR|nr:uncharacterized protein LOC100902995 [Galendromus occidentalis]